jgi:hypothetical protein
VVEWCEHHRNDAAQSADDDNDSRKKTTDIDEWDQKFMQVDQEMLFEIILVSLSLPHLPVFHSIGRLTDGFNRRQTTSTSRPSSMSAAKRSPT